MPASTSSVPQFPQNFTPAGHSLLQLGFGHFIAKPSFLEPLAKPLACKLRPPKIRKPLRIRRWTHQSLLGERITLLPGYHQEMVPALNPSLEKVVRQMFADLLLEDSFERPGPVGIVVTGVHQLVLGFW